MRKGFAAAKQPWSRMDCNSTAPSAGKYRLPVRSTRYSRVTEIKVPIWWRNGTNGGNDMAKRSEKRLGGYRMLGGLFGWSDTEIAPQASGPSLHYHAVGFYSFACGPSPKEGDQLGTT